MSVSTIYQSEWRSLDTYALAMISRNAMQVPCEAPSSGSKILSSCTYRLWVRRETRHASEQLYILKKDQQGSVSGSKFVRSN